MQSAAASGMRASAGCAVDDAAMRELIGISPDATFEQAEAVQAIVAWTDAAPEPVPPPTAPRCSRFRPSRGRHWRRAWCRMGRSSRCMRIASRGATRWTASCTASDGTLAAPGERAGYERAPIEEPSGGKGVGPLLMKRRPVQAFHRKAISRDEFLAINKLALRGPAYYPLVPDGLHAGLVRPLWILHDVVGLDPGLWYYHPQIDRWSMLVRGNFRLETAYLSREQNLAADASAVCVLVANIHYLIQTAGPDAYRLAHIEAGVVAHRMQLTAEAAPSASAARAFTTKSCANSSAWNRADGRFCIRFSSANPSMKNTLAWPTALTMSTIGRTDAAIMDHSSVCGRWM